MKLYKLFLKYDCTQIGKIEHQRLYVSVSFTRAIEINPFGETPDKRGEWHALAHSERTKGRL